MIFIKTERTTQKSVIMLLNQSTKERLKIYIIISMLLIPGTIFGQTNEEIQPEHEVIAMIDKAGLEFPSKHQITTPDNLKDINPELNQTLNSFNVNQVRKGFPDFEPSDTLQVTPSGSQIRSMNLSRVFVFNLPNSSQRVDFIRKLKSMSFVVYAEKNGTIDLRSKKRKNFEINRNSLANISPNDPGFPDQWYLKNTGQTDGTVDADIDADKAWDIYKGNSTVKIAIVDYYSVDENHSDLSGRVGGDISMASGEHPTSRAGVAGANTDNSIDVAGVDWNADINTQSTDESNDYTAFASAIRDAADPTKANADIVSHAWGQDDTHSTTIASAFAYAYKQNAANTLASIQPPIDTQDYPGKYDPDISGFINVAATDNKDEFQSLSFQYNDVAAPGGELDSDGTVKDEILMLDDGGGTRWATGTSFAVPQVAGASSLLQGYVFDNIGNFTWLGADDVEKLVKMGAEDIGYSEDKTGSGRLNIYKSLDTLRYPNYIAHHTASGGSKVSSSSYYFLMQIMGAKGISNGLYFVKRKRVEKQVNYPFTDHPTVWGRGRNFDDIDNTITGWHHDNVPQSDADKESEAANAYGAGFAGVKGSAVTRNSATLYTYVYEVCEANDEDEDDIYSKGLCLGTYPTTASNVNWAYTVHGQQVLNESKTISENVTFTEDQNIEVSDNVTVTFDGKVTIEEDVIIEMGKDAYLIFEGELDVNGKDGEEVIVKRHNSNDKWGNLVIKGNGSSIKEAELKGGQFALKIEAKNVTVKKAHIHDNSKGINASSTSSGDRSSFTLSNVKLNSNSGDGIFLWSSNAEIKNTTIRQNTNYGIWMYDSDINTLYKTVIDSNDSNGDDAGIKVNYGSAVEVFGPNDGEGYTRIADNGNLEISAGKDAQDFISAVTTFDFGGTNSIYDQDDDSNNSEYYIRNEMSNNLNAKEVWWEAEPPYAGHFTGSGGIDTDDFLYTSTDPTKDNGAGAQLQNKKNEYPILASSDSEVPSKDGKSKNNSSSQSKSTRAFQDSLDGLISTINNNPYSAKTPSRITKLYKLYSIDDENELGYRAEVMNLFKDWRTRVYNLNSGQNYTEQQQAIIHQAGEKAIIYGTRERISLGLIDSADAIIKDYAEYITTNKNRRRLILARFDVNRLKRNYQQALENLETYKKITESESAYELHEKLVTHINYMQNHSESSSANSSNNSTLAEENKENSANYSLKPAYPNPFNPTTTIRFKLAQSQRVQLNVYNTLGQKVATVLNKSMQAGSHSVQFNGSGLTSGVYIYRIKAGEYTETKKMMLMK